MNGALVQTSQGRRLGLLSVQVAGVFQIGFGCEAVAGVGGEELFGQQGAQAVKGELRAQEQLGGGVTRLSAAGRLMSCCRGPVVADRGGGGRRGRDEGVKISAGNPAAATGLFDGGDVVLTFCEAAQELLVKEAVRGGTGGQTQIGVVGTQQEAVFRPRGKHAIRFVGILGDQIVQEDPDVGLIAPEHQRRERSDRSGGIYPGQ